MAQARIDLDVVAHAGRNVLDLQGALHGKAPLVFGMTTGFETWGVVGRVIVVSDSRELEQTPGLVDLDHADQIRSARASEVVETVRTAQHTCRRSSRQVQHARLRDRDRVLKRQDARYAIAELSSVGELVHTIG